MAVQFDRSVIGREFDRTTFPPVTADDIREYAAASGETNPRYTDEAPRGGMVAPPTFPVSLRGRHFMPKELHNIGRGGFDAGKDIELGEPVRPGDVLTAVSIVHDVYEKTGRTGTMTFIVFRTTVTNQRQEMVAVVDQRMMFR